MTKIKILKFCEYYWFKKYEKNGYYYFVVEFIYENVAKFRLYHKLNVFFSGFIFFIIFLICYIYDIRLFTLFIENINNIFNSNNLKFINNQLYINIIINSLDFILQRKLIFICIIIFLFYIFLTKIYGLSESGKILISLIYKRLNFLINLEIFTYLLNLNGSDFIEYNFIFLILIIILFFIKLFSSFVLGKSINYNITHFLGLPYICYIFIYCYLIHSKFLFELLHYVWDLNKTFFLMGFEDISENEN